MRTLRALVAAAAALVAAQTARADSTVVPAANTSVDAGTLFFLLPGSATQIAYQEIIGSAALSNIPVGSLLVGVTWRLDADGGAAYPPAGITFTQYDITIATSLNAPGAQSTTVANNIGIDAVTVRSGSLTVGTGAFPGGNTNPTPNAFGLRIPFATPFVYEGGNLVLTARISGNSSATGRSVDANPDGTPNFQAHYAFSAASATVPNVANCVVSRFDFIPPVGVNQAFAPFDRASAEGPTNFYPLINDTATTFQAVISSTEFTSLPRGALINGVTWRLDSVFDPAAWPGSTVNYTKFDIQISQSVNPVGSMSATIASNQGADVTTVRSGALTIPAFSFPNGGSPTKFGFTIPFTTPYTYHGGDLHIVVRHSGSGISPAGFSEDGVFTNGSARVQSGFMGGSSTATTTTTDAIFPVTRFSVLDSPVVSSATVVSPGGGGFGILWAPTPITYQSIIGPEELNYLRPGSVVYGLSWRLWPNGGVAWPPTDAPITSLDITLSQAATTPATMSDTFASNDGPGLLTVRSGPIIVPAHSYPGGASSPAINGDGLYIPFTTPFVYQGGDLCLTVRHTGATGQPIQYWDAVGLGGPGQDSRFAARYAQTYGAISSFGDANVLITRLHGAPSVCLPVANATAEPSNNTVNALSNADRVVQYLFDFGQLASVPEGSVLTAMAFRKSDGQANQPAQDVVFGSYTVQVSTSPNTPTTMSNTFADNIGGDVTTVRDGPLTVPALKVHGTQSPSTPSPDWFFIPFDRPYVYNGGPLCVTIHYTGNGTEAVAVDANVTLTADYSARGALTSNALTGTTGFNPAVMRLAFTAKRCPADYDGNGFVNGEDFDAFNYEFYFGTPFADFDGNGFTNGEDFDAYNIFFYFGC